MIDLNGKVAVITGAGSGIGANVAERLYRLNAYVNLIARSEEGIKSIARGLDKDLKRASYYCCDVVREGDLKDVLEWINKDMGKVDILVTCAAASAMVSRAEELSYQKWREVLSIDLDGTFLSCKVFGAHMLKRRYGRIVNMTSFHTIATYPFRVAYNAAKSGVEGLTRALAVEWGRYNITVNAVAPGPIRTPRTSFFLSQSPDVEAGMLSRTPAVRIGETEDVASLVAFLVSDEARHINGQQIVIDGGWTKSAWWGDYSTME